MAGLLTYCSFALGLFVPPAFRNITYKTFIIFGILCFAAAVQAWLTYPETCGKTLEEIEILFGDDGPKPWNTKPGGSRLEAEIQAVIDRKIQGEDVHVEAANTEKNATVDSEKATREVAPVPA